VGYGGATERGDLHACSADEELALIHPQRPRSNDISVTNMPGKTMGTTRTVNIHDEYGIAKGVGPNKQAAKEDAAKKLNDYMDRQVSLLRHLHLCYRRADIVKGAGGMRARLAGSLSPPPITLPFSSRHCISDLYPQCCNVCTTLRIYPYRLFPLPSCLICYPTGFIFHLMWVIVGQHQRLEIRGWVR
jgi:hypothetical protein